MKKKQSNRSPSEWRPLAFAGYTLIAMTFGVAGVWAAVAKLDKAVIASGFVETETNRKTVQHLEGGIVRDILVKEGDHVVEGQVLFRLEQVQAEATNELLRNSARLRPRSRSASRRRARRSSGNFLAQRT